MATAEAMTVVASRPRCKPCGRGGGVLEHPAWSGAWKAFALPVPGSRGWSKGIGGEWVCEVSQAAYGHEAQKLTWLLYVGASAPPRLDWSRPEGTAIVSYMTTRADGSRFESDKYRLPKKQAKATPLAFRDLLLSIARSAHDPRR